MAAEDSKTYVRMRKHKRVESQEEIPDSQGRGAEFHSLQGEKNEDLISEEEAAKRLINLELDVAEALVEFWRMAREPSQQGNFDVHLRWSCKRLRSSLSKDSIAPCKSKEDPEDAISSAKNRSSCTSERDSMFSDRDEIDSTRMSKESSPSESRAESPSTPLPSLQPSCGAFLPRGSPTAKSAFQRVLPLRSRQKPCLFPVKSEIEEDMQLDGFDVRPGNFSGRRKLRPSKCAMSKSAVKRVSLGEQTIDSRDRKGVASPEVSRVKSELCLVPDLTVLNKLKPALSEKEKEARRLLRIEANRESARQTIWRKQVVCEELMNKVSSLAFENEGMKQKRESLMQKLFCLRGQNYQLKQQLEMETSGNLGLTSAELPLQTLSESVSVPALQVPSLQCARLPAHSFTWVMAASEAAAENQAHTFNNRGKTPDAIHTNLFLQHEAATLTLPAMPSSKEGSVSRIIEQSLGHVPLNGVCSPAAMGRSSQKERGCTKLEHTESRSPQSEEAPCDPSSTTAVAHLALTDDLPEESAHMQSSCSLSQPCSPTTCISQAGLNTMPAIAVAHDSMEGYKHSQITQEVRCGYTYDDSRGGYFFSVPSQTNGFRGRNHFGVIAAAEARKRRKELTRQKFSRSRAHRLAILGDNR